MKKVLSVALASSMVLGLGMNAFALEYNTGANDEADWPSNFVFDGSIFVTDKDDNLVTTSTASLGSKAAADFRPGDVIWMPLYANDQKSFTVSGQSYGYPAVKSRNIELTPALGSNSGNDDQVYVDGTTGGPIVVKPFYYRDSDNKVLYYYSMVESKFIDWAEDNGFGGYRVAEIPGANVSVTRNGSVVTGYDAIVSSTTARVDVFGNVPVAITKNSDVSYSFKIGSTELTSNVAVKLTTSEINNAKDASGATVNFSGATNVVYSTLSLSDVEGLIPANMVTGTTQTVNYNGKVAEIDGGGNAASLISGVKVNVTLPALKEISASDGTIVGTEGGEETGNGFTNTAYGPYTGKIDKNWSINLLEKTKGAEEVIDSAEFYRADAGDVAMYPGKAVANAVYVKVTLKDFFDSVSDATLKYYVYVADNNGTKNDKTNEVWVEGKYENDSEKYVNFDWSNNANSPAVWKVRKGENGTAVFDFEDKVFFTVKMYSEEKMYLDLNTAYDKIVAGDFSEADFDSFFKFEGTNANFSREGQLLLASDDEDLFVYEVDADGNLIPVDAEYVKDYKIAHTNTKANGYLFNTKELGNYVLSATELEADDEEVPEEPADDNNDDVVEEPAPEEPTQETPSTSKPNPNTGANDFVGVAVALAVVSVAAAGALALKK